MIATEQIDEPERTCAGATSKTRSLCRIAWTPDYLKRYGAGRMPSNCETLQIQLARLTELDRDYLVFGADHHKYRQNPPASEKQIRGFEERHGFTFPYDYREYLSQVADGGTGPDYGLYSLHEISRQLFTGLREDQKPHIGQTFRPPTTLSEAEDMDYPTNGMIPVSHIGCGMMSLLIVTGPQAGKMWYYSNHPAYLPYTHDPLTFASGTPMEERIRIGEQHATSCLQSSDRLSFWDWYTDWIARGIDDLEHWRLEHRGKRNKRRRWWPFW